MKNWKCLNCAREHQTKENITECFCQGCFSAMVEFPIRKRSDKKDKDFL